MNNAIPLQNMNHVNNVNVMDNQDNVEVGNRRFSLRGVVKNPIVIGVFVVLIVCTVVLLTYMAVITPHVTKNRSKPYLRTDSLGHTVLDEVPLIDGHNDLPYNLYTFESNQIHKFRFNRNLKTNSKWSSGSHTDIPRLVQGKMGSQFWVAYAPCATQYKDAVERTLEQIDVIKRLVAQYPQQMKYIASADGIMQAFKEKKIGSLIAVEGGHSIDSRLAVLRMYYELGVRYMTLTHTCNTPWANASPVDANATTVLKGLTEWGTNVIKEMNRLGMMIDISHVSHGVMIDVLEKTKAPVIFSHSSSYHVFPHHRNVRDDVLKMLVKNNGIIMVNFYTEYIGGKTIDKVVEHLNYIKSVTGPNHIGIGSDYDGVDSMPQGLEDVSKYPDLFDKLANGTYNNGTMFKAWTRDDLKKLACRNFIRVFREVENVRMKMADINPYEDIIPYQEFVDAGVANQTCMSDMDIHKY